MTEPKNQIKTALNQISVPNSKLDSIIDDAFQGEKVRKKKWIFPVLKYSVAIILVSVLTFSSALASPTFAKFVAQIPLIGSAFNYFAFEKDYYKSYKELSTDIGIVEESNGIEMIIDRAIYDGNLVTLSFVIRTKEELGTRPHFENLPQVKGRVHNISSDIEYIKGVGYAGIMTIAMFEDNVEIVNIEWEPKAITTFTGSKRIQGDWEFKFSLKELPSTYIPINQEVSDNGITVRLIDAEKTDVNLSINYSQVIDPNFIESTEYVEAELYAIDNLGNEYKVPYNGGTGIVDGNHREDMTWNATIHGLDKEATSITFYPFAHVGKVPSEPNEINSERIEFEPIIVNLK